MDPFIIAVDGTAGSGKSTICYDVCKNLGFSYVNTGMIYRAIAYVLLKENITTQEKGSFLKVIESFQKGFRWDSEEQRTFYFDQELTNRLGDEKIGRAITIKRKVNGPNGMVRNAPKLVDENKLPIDVLVGNGSRVRVQYNEWETSNKFGDFKGLDFQAMQVIDLVSYKSADGEEFDSLEGGEEF